MAFKKNLMYQVNSTNIDSVGLFDAVEIPAPEFEKKDILVVKVQFVRGGVYIYWPVTEAEFEKVFDDITSVKDWFDNLKETKQFNRLV
jgi:hypothetical protein